MPPYLVESRGFFWQSELVVPDTHFAHPTSVPGVLRVSETGRIDLELDAPLGRPDPVDRVSRLFHQGPVEGSVAGVLTGTDERVWLGGLSRNGGNTHTDGPSTEAYLASQCLISHDRFNAEKVLRFSRLDIPLDGLEDWLVLRSIKVRKTERTVSATYRSPAAQRWSLKGQTLELARWIDGPHAPKMREVAWQERASLRLLRSKRTLTAHDAIDLTSKIQDLLILLTDSNRGVPFPILRRTRKSPPVRLYYRRARRGPEPVIWDQCFASFGLCREPFGAVLENWLGLYDRFGPGVHLYLGNRRGQVMYPEHRFASLVWGLEALHRTLYPAPATHPNLVAKVQRILDAIATKKDRDWAERWLPQSDEPSLATRIAQLLATLPLEFQLGQLKTFAERCAKRRNDVSHFGGRRAPGDYDAFVDDIQLLSSALSVLYHALLLHLAGLPTSLVQRRFIDGHSSFAAVRVLEDAGLTLLSDQTVAAGEDQAISSQRDV
ncbi:hypothetical protein C8D77_107162 [Mesorhizobium loti]|uniref:ApeA N-terminal domain-containing protein n=1 Tax=Rhizobium loti TaxID=381 RepID=A0A8E3B3P9_RHILI|nr:HEPN domain-containing protein [Mesorhizobium loti]PWJ89518.1 hypothetical protein C8D77_107162 [Mesorhizobium loti]